MMTVTAAFGATFLLFSQSAEARTQHQQWRAANNVAHYKVGSRAYASAYGRMRPAALPITHPKRDIMATARAHPLGAVGR